MQIGLIGLGVMGRNLALSMRDAGLQVVATDAWESAREWRADGVQVVESASALVEALEAPRVILLMIKAGAPVDEQLTELKALLAHGDTVMDGGNSFYQDTARRDEAYREAGFGFLGIGISGGAEGARHGAAMMVGGPEENWKRAQPLLTNLAAKAQDRPCLAWFGAGGAGHFVKMVHNGIEYAVMQALAEAYALMRGPGGLAPEAVGAQFERWGAGPLGGYLMEISGEILQTKDPESGGPIIDVIADRAGQKGTGAWCASAGLDYSVPIPAIMEAVTARQISASTALRKEAQAQYGASPEGWAPDQFADLVAASLGCTTIAAMSQGLQLIAAASEENNWQADLTDAAHVWRAGSILRMRLLDLITEVFAGPEAPATLVGAAPISRMLLGGEENWRKVVGLATMNAVPAPVMTSSLAWFDAIRTDRLPTALVQGQRDRFGHHGFERTDQDGKHHGPWAPAS